MVALRTAATLAYALPSVRIRVGSADRFLVEVRRPPLPPGLPLIAPCPFRRTVAAAHERWSAGERLTFLGLPADRPPTVETLVDEGDLALPADLYRVALGTDWLHLFATALPVKRCRSAAAGTGGVGFHRDVATDITLVHRACAAGDLVASHQAIDDLVGVLGRCLTEELADSLPATR